VEQKVGEGAKGGGGERAHHNTHIVRHQRHSAHTFSNFLILGLFCSLIRLF
jgi:hypothetical protein